MQATSGTPVADPRAVRRRPQRRRILTLVAIAVLVVAADEIAKSVVVATLSDRPPVHVIGDVLRLTLLRNSGAAFGLGAGDTVIFTVVAVAVVVTIARQARRLRSTGWSIALGLLLGGAVGNLSDRIFRAPGIFQGHVVDWIELPHWPVFNLADSAIVVGAVLAFLLSAAGVELDGRRRSGRPDPHAAAEHDGALDDNNA